VAACERAVVDVRLSQTDRAASFVNYGVALRKRGRTQAALAAYDRALVIAPELAEAWLNRSAALAALDRDEEALSAVNRALTLNLATPQIALVNRALILERRGEAQAAYTDLRAALELDPAYAPALLALERYEVADE
jgi:tetratricopeptide (TPR) repeat protein